MTPQLNYHWVIITTIDKLFYNIISDRGFYYRRNFRLKYVFRFFVNNFLEKIPHIVIL